jgi:hypothetical protein
VFAHGYGHTAYSWVAHAKRVAARDGDGRRLPRAYRRRANDAVARFAAGDGPAPLMARPAAPSRARACARPRAAIPPAGTAS